MPPEFLVQAKLWRCPATHAWQNTDTVPEMPADGADVWLCPLTADAKLSLLLSDDEIERAQNFFPDNKADEFKLARGWLRLLLASYVGVTEPRLIRLGIAEGGKPYLIDYPALNFNLSHSGTFVAIAVSPHRVGIDIEKLRALPDWLELAEGLLTNMVIEKITELPTAERGTEFLRQFTAREAYLKAKGTGLSESMILREQEFHSIGMENHNYDPTLALPEIPGYIGQLCLLPH